MRAFIIVLLIVLPPAVALYEDHLDRQMTGRWSGGFDLTVQFTGFADGELRSVSADVLARSEYADQFHLHPWVGDEFRPFHNEPIKLMVWTGGSFSPRSPRHHTYHQDRFLALWLEFDNDTKRTITVPIPDNRLTPGRPIMMEVIRGSPEVKVTFGKERD